MKREIEFRGYNGMKWIFGSAVLCDESQDAWYMIEKDDPSNEWMMVGHVGEYTGIKDVNEKKVYEGDLVEKRNAFGTSTGEVIYLQGSFRVQFKNSWGGTIETFKAEFEFKDMGATTTLKNTYEVVGTVHDKVLDSL